MSAIESGSTVVRRIEQFRDRWTSFEDNPGILEFSDRLTPSQLKRYELFKEYDDKFLDKISPDISVAKWSASSTLYEEGSYIDLVFFVLSGEIAIKSRVGVTTASQNIPIFDADRTMAGPVSITGSGASVTASGGDDNQTLFQTQIGKSSRKEEITLLATMDVDLSAGGVTTLGAGSFVGELGTSVGWPQGATAVTTSDCTLIQIRLPAIKLMKRKSKALKEQIDTLYRQNALQTQLESSPLFRECKPDFIREIASEVKLVSCEANESIVSEGEVANSVYLVRSGFVKLTKSTAGRPVVVTYLSKGMLLGDAEFLIEDLRQWRHSAVTVEHAELVEIPFNTLQKLLDNYPGVSERLWSATVERIKETGRGRRDVKQSLFIETALEEGLVEGNSILVIDLDVCTRCDDCVRACAATHEGTPRFVREGTKLDNLLITRSCYHCSDPVCLIGCPTGAIRRAQAGDVVEIDSALCIGCNACASNCPYDAITMRATGEVWPSNAIPSGLRGKDKIIAVKCDMCNSTGHDPACVSNCPHGCAMRVNKVEDFVSL